MSWAELTRRSTNFTDQAIGFSFDYLWNITLELNRTDPRSPLLYHPHDNQTRLCLTYDACVAKVGAGNVLYNRRDVYDRVLLWRVPLIALVATTTLPTLGYHTQLFTILHLIASPIDTLWSLFYKLDLARRHADWAAANSLSNSERKNSQTALASNRAQQSQEQRLREAGSSVIATHDLDVIALIINAYQDQADLSLEKREEFRSCCASAAAFIAADRVARMLPSFVATLVFFPQLFAGFWKTLNNFDTRPREDLNRAPHNIAFGALYFWLPFAILTTAIVGGAQTDNSVPRILKRLRNDTIKIFPEGGDERQLSAFPELKFSMSKRRIAGGLPTWQPDKFQDWNNEHLKFFVTSLLLSMFIVAIPALAAIWVSWRTPTEGFGCRSLSQTCFFVSWIVSYSIDWFLTVIPESPAGDGAVRSQWIYWITFVKDLSLTVGAITMLTYSSIGIFNNCNCWTKWFPGHAGSQRYLSFPQEQVGFDTIKHRLQYEFAIVTTVALGIELLIFFLVWDYFRHGHHVLKQRDMEDVLKQQNMEPGWFKRCWTRFRGFFTRKENQKVERGEDDEFNLETMPMIRHPWQNSSPQRRQNTSTLESQPDPAEFL